MVKCNQLCEWNRYKHGCAKPLHVACPLEAALGNTGVANENPMTNADRIRAMSDEQLAKYLFDVERGNFTIDCCDDRFCDTQNCCHDCTDAAIKWLKQPAEEET